MVQNFAKENIVFDSSGKYERLLFHVGYSSLNLQITFTNFGLFHDRMEQSSFSGPDSANDNQNIVVFEIKVDVTDNRFWYLFNINITLFILVFLIFFDPESPWKSTISSFNHDFFRIDRRNSLRLVLFHLKDSSQSFDDLKEVLNMHQTNVGQDVHLEKYEIYHSEHTDLHVAL